MMADFKDKMESIAIATMEIVCFMFPLEEWELEDSEESDGSAEGFAEDAGFAEAASSAEGSGSTDTVGSEEKSLAGSSKKRDPTEETGVRGSDSGVRALVGFHGAADGCMVLHPCHRLLEAIAVNMLGIEEATREQQEGALCEVANIICGNTVPLFAADGQVCILEPPEIIDNRDEEASKKTMERYAGTQSESVVLTFDEGVLELKLYWSGTDRKSVV